MKSHHFVLVHGACHGAWCWYKVSKLLQNAGHVVTTIDLQSAGISSDDPGEVRTLEQYSSPLIAVLHSITEPVFLVGHSLGGASVSLAMEQLTKKVKAAIFLTALMIKDGSSDLNLLQYLGEAIQDNFDYHFVNGIMVSAAFKQDNIASALYNLSPEEDVILAKSLLKPRPHFDAITSVTKNGYGSVPRFFIKAIHDNIILPEMQTRIIENNPPTKVFEIDSDHSPFFSKAGKLVDILVEIADFL